MKVVDRAGKPAPTWLVAMLSDADAVREDPEDTFWDVRRSEYRVVSC